MYHAYGYFNNKEQISELKAMETGICLLIIIIIYHYCANFASEGCAQGEKYRYTYIFTIELYNHLICF